jgi:hypothetical protein
MATIATGPLSSTAFVPSVWLSMTMRCGLCPATVARIDGVTTRLTFARSESRAVGWAAGGDRVGEQLPLVRAEERAGDLPLRALVRLVVADDLLARQLLHEEHATGAGGGRVPDVGDACVVREEVAVERRGGIDRRLRIVEAPADDRERERGVRDAAGGGRADDDLARGVRGGDRLVAGNERQWRGDARAARRLRVRNRSGHRQLRRLPADGHRELRLAAGPPLDREVDLARRDAVDLLQPLPDPVDVPAVGGASRGAAEATATGVH